MAPCSAARTHPTLRKLLVYRTNMSQAFSSEWETFFTELARVVASANNQRGLANEDFSEYVTAGNDHHVIITINNMNLEKLFGIPFA